MRTSRRNGSDADYSLVKNERNFIRLKIARFYICVQLQMQLKLISHVSYKHMFSLLYHALRIVFITRVLILKSLFALYNIAATRSVQMHQEQNTSAICYLYSVLTPIGNHDSEVKCAL